MASERTRYAALSALKRRKKSRDYVDYDYLDKLRPDELAFLNQFTDEYYNGNAYKFAEPLLDRKEMSRKNYAARSDMMNEFQRVDAQSSDRGLAASEVAIVEALDAQNRPALIAPPTPVSLRPLKTLGTTGSRVFPSNRPVIERLPDKQGAPSMNSSIPFNRLESDVTKKKVKNRKLAAAMAPKGAPTATTFSPEAVFKIYENISGLLKIGMFPGSHALHVAEAIKILDDTVALGPKSTPAPVPTVVPDAGVAANE